MDCTQLQLPPEVISAVMDIKRGVYWYMASSAIGTLIAIGGVIIGGVKISKAMREERERVKRTEEERQAALHRLAFGEESPAPRVPMTEGGWAYPPKDWTDYGNHLAVCEGVNRGRPEPYIMKCSQEHPECEVGRGLWAEAEASVGGVVEGAVFSG